jgi:hypothetical protein
MSIGVSISAAPSALVVSSAGARDGVEPRISVAH